MSDMAELWRTALGRLRERIPTSQVDTWVAPLRPLRLEGDDILVLGVGNEFQKTYLGRNCQARIEEALSAAAAVPVRVRFEVETEGQGLLFPHPESPATEAGGPTESTRPAAAGVPAALRPRPSRPGSYPDAGGLPLSPKYQFETFVVGANNRFAHAAALGVAEKPGRMHNPLFLYGGVGLGKTHLLHAIGNAVGTAFPQKRILYTTMEKFTNDMIKAIRDQNTSELRRKYRFPDLLLIDDIQFLQGKESTQDEFFHTINDLMAGQRQIVATSDTHPKDIKVEERLKSRFQGGLVADLQAPDVETRIAILRAKTDRDGLAVPEEALAVIAAAVQSNIRELEGALNRVVAMAAMTGQPASADLARDALRDLISVNRPPRTFERIQTAVARHFALEPSVLNERTRTDAVAYPRQLAMYLCREMLGASSVLIGTQFGGRDHSTVLHALEKIRRMHDSDPQTRDHLPQIRRSLDL